MEVEGKIETLAQGRSVRMEKLPLHREGLISTCCIELAISGTFQPLEASQVTSYAHMVSLEEPHLAAVRDVPRAFNQRHEDCHTSTMGSWKTLQ